MENLKPCSMLDVRTAHVPSNTPDFGKLRHVHHEYGWIVFVSPDAADHEEDVPAWLRPLHDQAVQESAVLINFDADAEEYDDIPKWVW